MEEIELIEATEGTAESIQANQQCIGSGIQNNLNFSVLSQTKPKPMSEYVTDYR